MIRLLCVLVVITTSVYCIFPELGSCPKIPTQQTVDLSRYLGVWYELYRFPSTFERGKCVRANYTLKADGRVEVDNRYIEDGQTVQAIGDAYRPDDNVQGKLSVRFTEQSPYANYFIINTDYDTYSLVYSCIDLINVLYIEFAWILSRDMILDDTKIQELQQQLASYNVSISKFLKVDQTDCPP